MSKFFKTNRKINKIIIMVLIGIIALSCASCGSKKDDNNLNNDEYCPSSSLVMTEADAKLLNENLKITVYYLSQDGKSLVGEDRNMKITEAKKSAANIATAIVNELLKGPAQNSKGKRCIPEGTKVLEPVKISGTTAIINLSSDFVNKVNGDKTAIEMCIYSLVNSVTEVKELNMVKILIDGKEQKDVKGVVRTDLAFKRNKSLISVVTAKSDKDTIGDAVTEEEEILE